MSKEDLAMSDSYAYILVMSTNTFIIVFADLSSRAGSYLANSPKYWVEDMPIC